MLTRDNIFFPQPHPRPSVTPHPFHITPSQDPLNVSSPHDDQHVLFDHPSVGAGETSAPVLPLGVYNFGTAMREELQRAERQSREEEMERGRQRMMACFEEMDRQREEREARERAAEPREEEEEEETEQSQTQSEDDRPAVRLPPGLANVAARPISWSDARLPGSTESSQSSDEITALRRRVRQELSESAVPIRPHSSLVADIRAKPVGDQVLQSSQSGESSSEAQILPGSERRKPSADLPQQKVPKLTSSQKRMLRLRTLGQPPQPGIKWGEVRLAAVEEASMETEEQEERAQEGEGGEEMEGEEERGEGEGRHVQDQLEGEGEEIGGDFGGREGFGGQETETMLLKYNT